MMIVTTSPPGSSKPSASYFGEVRWFFAEETGISEWTRPAQRFDTRDRCGAHGAEQLVVTSISTIGVWLVYCAVSLVESGAHHVGEVVVWAGSAEVMPQH
jgi:hypothetical protein